MPGRTHRYAVKIEWTGNLGEGTSTYRAYSRDHAITADGKPALAGSSDHAFRGDASRYNPEDLLVSALSACHMLSYLHLCAVNGIVVTAYEDRAGGEMRETADGGGRFVSVLLRPRVTVRSGNADLARRLHEEAHRLCFIATSVNFPVACEPEIVPEREKENGA